MGVIERFHDAVLDQRSDAVVAEFVAEGFRVVVSVGSEAPRTPVTDATWIQYLYQECGWKDRRIPVWNERRPPTEYRPMILRNSNHCTRRKRTV